MGEALTRLSEKLGYVGLAGLDDSSMAPGPGRSVVNPNPEGIPEQPTTAAMLMSVDDIIASLPTLMDEDIAVLDQALDHEMAARGISDDDGDD